MQRTASDRGRTRLAPRIPLKPGAPGILTPALAVLLVLQVLSGVLVAPLLTLFPVYVERVLGASTEFSAAVRITSVLAGGLMALIGGALCDLLGRKPSYLLAMTGVISAGLVFLVRDRTAMFALSAYSGLMFGLGSVAGLSYVMESTRRETLALATGAYFLMGTLGNAVGSSLSGWIAHEFGRGYALLGWGMTVGHTLLLLVAALLLPGLPRPAVARTLEALAGGYAELFRRREIWALLGIRFLPTVYWGSVTFVMPLLLFRLTGAERVPGFYSAASLIVSAVCQLAMGRVVDRFTVRVPVLIAITMVTIAALGQGLAARSGTGLMAFGLLGAGAAWSLSITMTTLVQELSTEETRAKLLGITHVAWSGGFLTGTAFTGHLAREKGHGPEALLISGGCCALGIICALGVVLALPRRGGG